jgi:hypothetical protein
MPQNHRRSTASARGPVFGRRGVCFARPPSSAGGLRRRGVRKRAFGVK